jgi:hypothetical protein
MRQRLGRQSRIAGVSMALAAVVVATIAGPSSQANDASPLQADLTVDVPGGRVVLVPPPALCAYPEAIAAQAAAAMQGLRLLVAAGSCEDMDRLVAEGVATKRSMMVAILDRDLEPTTRVLKPAFLRECFENLPPPGSDQSVSDQIAAFHEEAHGLQIDRMQPLGVRQATRDAIFGATVMDASRGHRTTRQVQVTACLVPGNIPLLWLFSATVDPAAGKDALATALQDLLSLSARQVAETVRRN